MMRSNSYSSRKKKRRARPRGRHTRRKRRTVTSSAPTLLFTLYNTPASLAPDAFVYPDAGGNDTNLSLGVSRALQRADSAAATAAAWPSDLTASNTVRSTPVPSIRNVVRITPMYFRPYNVFSCHTPYRSATA